MKKWISWMLALACLFTLTACTNKTPAATTPAPTPAPTEPELTIDDIDLKTMLYLIEDITGMGIGTYCYQQQITAENVSLVLGSESFDLPFSAGRAYLPTMNTTAFVLAVFRLEEGADTQAFMDGLKAKANPDRWVCVRAEATEVAAAENTVLFLMCNQMTAKSVVDAFLKMNEPGFRVEDHLVDRLKALTMTELYQQLFYKYDVANYGFLDGEDFGAVTPHTGYGLSDLDHGAYTDSLLDTGYYPANEYDGERSYLLVMFRLTCGTEAEDFAQELKAAVDTTGLKGQDQQYLLAWSEDVVVYYVGAGSLAWANSTLDADFTGNYRMETQGVQPW